MKSDKHPVVVRMAPSPTGNLHIGTARATLFNYLFAKQHQGKFILRIEDTDKERSKKEYEDNILDGLAWLGLEHDELFRQSERTDVYQSYLKKLIDSGHAYVSKEEIKKEGDRSEVIRFKNPNKKISFTDLIRGKVEFDTEELGDFIIARSETEPLYHLAVVVDDHEMGVTHIIRGEDHISNTPRQMLIGEAIGAVRPEYAHLPLVLAPDRKKLSKRMHGEAVWIDTYRKQGILPEAMLNYLALLGWNPGTDQEVFTLEELVREFGLDKVHKGGAIFDTKKLDWINKEHIKLLSPEEQKRLALESLRGESYIVGEPDVDVDKIPWKDTSREDTVKLIQGAMEVIGSDGDLMQYADQVGRGSVLWPVRYSLSGEERSPDPFIIMEALGKEASLTRLQRAVEMLNQ